MFKLSRKTLLRICSLHTVCWVAGAFLMMHFFILPTARKEVYTLAGHKQPIHQIAFWHPDALMMKLADYDSRSRTLYVATEGTAGILHSLLAFLFTFIFTIYLFLRHRIASHLLKPFLVIILIGSLADVLASIGNIYLVLVEDPYSGFLNPLIFAMSILHFSAYGVIIVGMTYVLAVHFLQLRMIPERPVNNS